MRKGKKIDVDLKAIHFKGNSNYSPSRPFSQVGLAIFSVFANSINLLCKLRYVNFVTIKGPGPRDRTPETLNLVF